jgi:hypothetical protein
MKQRNMILFVTVMILITITTVTAATGAKLQFFNGNLTTATNTLYLNFKLVNTGTSPINLSDAKLRYYFNNDGTQSDSFACDWASAGNSNITGAFTTTSGMERYFEVGFTSGAGTLAAGANTEVKIRVWKSDWSNFDQFNDYSFNATAANYADWNKVTVYISGTLYWGTVPAEGPTPASTTMAPTPTRTTGPTAVRTATPIRTATPVRTATPTSTRTPTPTAIRTVTPTPVRTATAVPTGSPIIGAIYVAPSGSDSNQGTIDSPMTLTAAIIRVVAGGTIYMRAGTYSYSTQITIARSNGGSSGAMKNILAYGSEKPVLDFSSQAYGDPSSVTNPRGLQIDGSYWHIKGLEVKGSADNGIYISGNGNIIELCNIHNNRDSGIQLGRYSSSATRSEWPSNNLILNCDSHDNADPDNYEDADGFACKLTTGTGNVFRGCVSYYNCDDGWDLFTKTETGAIDPVTIENCIAYSNGRTSTGASSSNSDGNGFKLGGDKIAVNHIVKFSIAFNNKKHGFTHNSNPGAITITNCTSWHNSTTDSGQTTSDYNFEFSEGNHLYTNNLSYAGGGSDHLGTGTDVSGSNVWWINSKSSSSKGLICDNADFVSLTPSISRNSDGSLNLGNFLKLATGSDLIGAGTPGGTNIGAR